VVYGTWLASVPLWHPDVWQLEAAVPLVPWHVAHVVVTSATLWIAAMSVPPVWQPAAVHADAAEAVWLAFTDACMTCMLPDATVWQAGCEQLKLVAETAGVGWHFTQELFVPFSPWSCCSSYGPWQLEQVWLVYAVPLMVIVPAVIVGTWLLWSAGSPLPWQVAHTSVGVLPLPWHTPQPLSLRPGIDAWIATTLVPPVWQPVPMHVGVYESVWLASSVACMTLMLPEAVV
jgi:hypothetical protein